MVKERERERERERENNYREKEKKLGKRKRHRKRERLKCIEKRNKEKNKSFQKLFFHFAQNVTTKLKKLTESTFWNHLIHSTCCSISQLCS